MTHVALETRMRRLERTNRGLWLVLAVIAGGGVAWRGSLRRTVAEPRASV